jgi:large subunit ribosomal protein L19e
MKLTTQKRIAAKLLKVGKTSVKFDPNKISDIKEAITKADIRGLIRDKAIMPSKSKGSISKGRLRKKITQKRKGRLKGKGTRKGKRTARLSKKEEWIMKVRAQRKFIKELEKKKLISRKTYREIYGKIKGNYFRSRNHIKLYLTENRLFENVKK